jgi:SAM-dependent methyltransferase
MNNSGTRVLNDVSQKYRDLLLKDIEEKKILLEDVDSCICCGSSALEKLLDIDRFELPFGSYLCQTCGLVSTSPRIKQESLPYYYETYYHPLNYGNESLNQQTALFHEGQGVKIFHKLRPYLDKTEISVLEIGAGVGNVLDEFRTEAQKEQIAVEVLGTEYSPECIIQCRNRDIETIEGNAESLLPLKKRFDVIILSHVFEHFIDLKNELHILQQLLHQDGVLYIEVPGILKIHDKHYYDFSFIGYSVHAHMYNFTAITLRNIVEQHGFTMLESNEEVEAVFTMRSHTDATIENDAIRIRHYLTFLEGFRASVKLQMEKCQKDIAHQHERITYRDKEIEKYKTQVENRNKDIKKYQTQVENRNKDIKKYQTQMENRKKDIEKLKTVHESCQNKLRSIYQTLHDTVKIPFYRNPLKKYKAYRKLIKDIYATKEK